MGNDFLPPKRGQLHGVRRTRPASVGWERPKTFRTPEAVAAHEQPLQTPSHPHQPQGNASSSYGQGGFGQSASAPGAVIGHHPAPKKPHGLKEWFKARTKKQITIMCAAAVLLLMGGGYAIYHFFIKQDAKPVAQKVQQTPVVTPPGQPLTAKLTGLPITDASINDRPVTAVMIENSVDARPQAGLSQAGVVFEAVAEGGITRFLTLFQDTNPDYLGPVRSVRPYYLQWLMGFDAAVAHVGGSADALALIGVLHVKDLDQFYNPGPYHRVSNRFAPHNMYTDVSKLRERQIEKGYTTSTYTGFARKEEAKSAAPNATYIDFNVSGALYNPHYDYDPAGNVYKRSEGGQPHMDEKAGQLAPKVVVALTMPQGANGIYTTYQTLGSGEAHIFQDGTVTKGTWHKNTETAQFTFTDASGAPLKLNPGQTWITVLGSSSRISYK